MRWYFIPRQMVSIPHKVNVSTLAAGPVDTNVRT
jgi:hypothetical protein